MKLPPDFAERITTRDDKAVVLTDTSHFPLILNRIIDKPTMRTTNEYFARHEKFFMFAKSAGQKVIVINDFTDSVTPEATVRKAFAEGADKYGKAEGSPVLAWIPILTNSLLRGVMTAVSWMIQDKSQVTVIYASNFPDAIRKANECFEKNNIPIPDIDETNYVFPN